MHVIKSQAFQCIVADQCQAASSHPWLQLDPQKVDAFVLVRRRPAEFRRRLLAEEDKRRLF